ncbi:MAG TPA: serine/threonine-protein kinase [Gemmataceae bacterium]|nr:serine/threonine-protein kinase [Gemmataceae bacterium]
MKFTYRSGQSPLAGFTIKRGVGQGTFGEVYFAVSDGGKEVALKLLRGHNLESELRGIRDCLNVKHPHLVHLYDLLTDATGNRWLVMEYVFGESLAQVINRHPAGLSTELAKDWFAALARGVGYLHDQGIVHRDLKPANIFIEHGHLKIGDYGLSRRVSGDRADMSRGVGTPRYMAPELGTADYTRTVDIYASGVILFEMLTGHPPFDGANAQDVILKHITEMPDLSKVPAAFVPVLERALDKSASSRYATMQEFARAVEAVGKPQRALDAAATADYVRPVPDEPRARPAHDTVVDFVPSRAERRRMAAPPVAPPTPTRPALRPRLTAATASLALAPVVVLGCVAPWGVFPFGEWALLGRAFILSTLLSWAAILIARKPDAGETTWGQRFYMLLAGAGVGAAALWLDGWVVGGGSEALRDPAASSLRFTPDVLSTGARYLFYFGMAAGACAWWRMSDPNRRQRVRVWPVVGAAFWASVFLFLWPWEAAPALLGIFPLVVAAVAVQVASPRRA